MFFQFCASSKDTCPPPVLNVTLVQHSIGVRDSSPPRSSVLGGRKRKREKREKKRKKTKKERKKKKPNMDFWVQNEMVNKQQAQSQH
jgi:hypothetical protein